METTSTLTSATGAIRPPPAEDRQRQTSRSMQAAALVAPGKTRINQVPVPEPGPNQVRVRIEGCGICGSNLPVWEGRPWFNYPLSPGEPGHEGWGTVDAVGTGVTRVQPGQRVAAISWHAFAQYDLASESAVVPLPPALDSMPFPGEALGCALNVFRRSDVRAGQIVAVVGVGFLGAVLTGLCAKAGATVVAISRRPFALEMARQMGAQECVALTTPQDVLEYVGLLTSNQGCDRVIEAVGHQGTLDLAGELTRERGRLIIAGYHQDGLRQVNLQLWNWRGLDVINAHERDPQVYCQGVAAAVQAVISGTLDPSPLYTHFFRGLGKLDCALNAMKERPDRFLKALLLL